VETRLTPEALLQQLLSIEQQHGRTRGPQRWTARTLDLDILLYGEEVISVPTLTVPHPGIAERNFVLYPLQEIAPGLIVPQLGPISSLVAGCELGDLVKLHHDWRQHTV
jgi:2-amino-4-hydroxy-6-hydroxymethyldihydropteridine diphosphokinase